jgi:hypothetical protein
MSKKWHQLAEAQPGYLVTLATAEKELVDPAEPDGPRREKVIPAAHITRLHGDYALVDAMTGAVIPTWPPAAVDALIQYRASRVQGAVPPKDPADAQ